MTTGRAGWDGPAGPAGYAASKVPLITAYFWIIKLLTTAMGEATSDYMVRTISPVTAVLLGFAGFVIAMVLQFRTRRYVAWVYWLAVVMVAVFGTMAADVLHIKFHVPYAASSTFYAIVLTVIFVLWYRSEGTLSIHSIRTPRREAFYWATVLATFALGTAVGDLTARTLHLGYLASGVLFTVLIMVPLVAHWRFGMNPILAFWIAYVLTRPVGASYADYVAFPKSVGGLDAGHGPVALALAVIIIGFVAYLSVTRRDVEEEAGESRYEAPAWHRRAVDDEFRPPPRPMPQGPGAGDYRYPSRPAEPRVPSEYRPPRQPMEPRGLSDIQSPRRQAELRAEPGEHRAAEPRPGSGEYQPTHRSTEPRPGTGEYRPIGRGGGVGASGAWGGGVGASGAWGAGVGASGARGGGVGASGAWGGGVGASGAWGGGAGAAEPWPAEPRSGREDVDPDWDLAPRPQRDDYYSWDDQ